MSNDSPNRANNGATLTVAKITKVVMSSAAEAESGALYINYRETIAVRHALIEMGHPQPPTSIQTNNTAALCVVINILQPTQMKGIPMINMSWIDLWKT